jgi:hypothetical protein
MYEVRFLPIDSLWTWLYTSRLREKRIPYVLEVTVACLLARCRREISPKVSPD